MKRFSVGLLLLTLVFGVFGVVAQDTTPEPTAEMTPGIDTGVGTTDDASAAASLDLEGLTNDPGVYIGQTVTLEGVVDDLLNVRAFILGEGAALDNDQVLVINTSGQEYDVRLTQGARFRVTGLIYPSFANGGLTQVVANALQFPDATAEPMGDAEATAEAITPNMEYSTNLASMIVPDELFNHTILVVSQIEDLMLLALPE
jgi:hypothetical protein